MTDTIANAPRAVAIRADIVAHLIGAFAVGSVALAAAFMVVPDMVSPYSLSEGFDLVDVAPELVLVVAVGLALVTRLRRFAWMVSAVGLFGLAALFAQGNALDRDQLLTLLALAAGLQFAGVLLAFAEAGPVARWAIALGLGLGFIAGPLWTGLVFRTALEGQRHSDDILVASLAALAVAAGVVLLVRRPEPGPPDAGRATWGPVIAIAIALVATVGLSLVWQLVLDGVAQSSTGGISQDRAEFIVSMDQLVRVLIGAAVAIVLTVAAYRRGGASLARWVVVAFGVALTNVAIPADYYTVSSLIGVGLVPAVLGATAGLAAVRWADRWFPWDALGIVLVAVAWLSSDRGQLEVPGLDDPSNIAGSFGLALALTAGLARLAVPGPDGELGRGLSISEVSMSAAFGIAALVLCQQVIGPISDVTGLQPNEAPLTLPLAMVTAAVVLVGLFGLGRLVRPTRTEPIPEAAASAG
jgi:hypothetical protein